MNNLVSLIDNETGIISPKAVANELHTTLKEVAAFSGLSTDTVSKQNRFSAKTSQKRLKDIVYILNRVRPWSGSTMQAYAWYRSEPIPSFGDLTAEDMVKQGKAEDVMKYIARIAEGGYA